MEEAHRVGERILDEHALGIAGDEILGGRACCRWWRWRSP